MSTVVIVEDEPMEAESLRRIVAASQQGVLIYDAPTGRKAMQLIDELPHIDLIFVDLTIPRPDGRQVIQYLRTKSSATRVIVTSASDDFDLLRSMLPLQIEDYLLKPIKKQAIIDKINGSLNADAHGTAHGEALKRRLQTLIARCDYPQWHDLLLDVHRRAFFGDNQASRELVLLLELICRQASLRPPMREKIGMLALQVGQDGVSKARYRRLVLLLLQASREIFDAALKTSTQSFVARAKFHIERGITENVTLDGIAAKSFISACYLSRKFKKETGTGFSAYVTHRKMQFACALLQFSDLNIHTVALELGWQDANYFCRIFKKETGMAPSDYCRQMTATGNNKDQTKKSL